MVFITVQNLVGIVAVILIIQTFEFGTIGLKTPIHKVYHENGRFCGDLTP